MALAGVLFLGAGIASGISGFYNAKNQQNSIKNQVCQLNTQMGLYKQLMSGEVNNLMAAQAEAQGKIQDAATTIATLKDSISMQHSAFKETYNRWVIIGVVFLILLIFLFSTKILILGATTESRTP